MNVRYSARATADIEQIRTYLFDRSPVGARHVADSIQAAIEQLAEMPLSGRSTDEGNVRSVTVTRYPYRVFYRIEGGTVHIVHVRHTARRPLRGLHEPAQVAFAHG